MYEKIYSIVWCQIGISNTHVYKSSYNKIVERITTTLSTLRRNRRLNIYYNDFRLRTQFLIKKQKKYWKTRNKQVFNDIQHLISLDKKHKEKHKHLDSTPRISTLRSSSESKCMKYLYYFCHTLFIIPIFKLCIWNTSAVEMKFGVKVHVIISNIFHIFKNKFKNSI